ncbi:hypothetical protein E2542_SST20508 [Spatholobus suberectus]|nr:hypothetical protein E2542_SST20508 [Spatholobus suberectus]
MKKLRAGYFCIGNGVSTTAVSSTFTSQKSPMAPNLLLLPLLVACATPYSAMPAPSPAPAIAHTSPVRARSPSPAPAITHPSPARDPPPVYGMDADPALGYELNFPEEFGAAPAKASVVHVKPSAVLTVTVIVMYASVILTTFTH